MTSPLSSPSPAPHLSVIVPAYNEAERIAPTMRSIEQYLRAQDFTFEALLVDDGSSDATVGVARAAWRGGDLRIVLQETNQGKGAAIRRGMSEARGEWRLFTDADNSTPIEELDKFWPWTREGYSVLAASRALPQSALESRQPFYREAMGRFFNLMVRSLALSGIHDSQCGFKMFSRAAAEAIFPRMQLRGWAFDVECLMLARGLGFRIVEIPVRWINSPATRVSAVSDSLRMAGDLWRLRRLYGKDARNIAK
ncbi:MAG: glycosyltransferase family 2 protein [Candidatus Sumerlaeota bacterium]|nr:glycosyltransferase family 2 protein [Candidatus Sumerlaeota bacterium]